MTTTPNLQNKQIRSLLCGLLLIAALLPGCGREPTPPTFPPVDRITAQLYSVPDMGIKGIDEVKVPPECVTEVLQIVIPVTFKKHGIRPISNYHVADVFLHHKDAHPTKIEVRCTGHNPAAVSIDGSNYFYASVDGPADGARGLADLLTMIQYKKLERDRLENEKEAPSE